MGKEKKVKEYMVPKRKQPFFCFVKSILRLVLIRKPKLIINENEEMKDQCIVVSNHAAKNGPVALELYFPKFNVKWGAYQMLGNYKMRYHYLRDVYYIQKCGRNKFIASILASFEAFFSQFFYKGLKFIGTYQDKRFIKTIKDSKKVLDANYAVTIFPEDSEEGYKEVLTHFHSGFVVLADSYYKDTGIDVPIYPTYFHLKKRVMAIGKPLFVQELKQEGLSRDQIAEKFKDKVNSLFHSYIEN